MDMAQFSSWISWNWAVSMDSAHHYRAIPELQQHIASYLDLQSPRDWRSGYEATYSSMQSDWVWEHQYKSWLDLSTSLHVTSTFQNGMQDSKSLLIPTKTLTYSVPLYKSLIWFLPLPFCPSLVPRPCRRNGLATSASSNCIRMQRHGNVIPHSSSEVHVIFPPDENGPFLFMEATVCCRFCDGRQAEDEQTKNIVQRVPTPAVWTRIHVSCQAD